MITHNEVCQIADLHVMADEVCGNPGLTFAVRLEGGGLATQLTRNQVDDLMCCLALWMAQHGGRPEAGQVETERV